MNKWIKIPWLHIHIPKCHSVMIKEILSFAITLMNLKNIMLNETSQTQKEKHSYMWTLNKSNSLKNRIVVVRCWWLVSGRNGDMSVKGDKLSIIWMHSGDLCITWRLYLMTMQFTFEIYKEERSYVFLLHAQVHDGNYVKWKRLNLIVAIISQCVCISHRLYTLNTYNFVRQVYIKVDNKSIFKYRNILI